MHLLTVTSTSLDETAEPVDLEQTPGDVIVLSFSDSDLTGLAAAWREEREWLPSVRLTPLRELRHPMSVDLWIDRVATKAKVIVVRLLGGLDWWRYGAERLSALARARGIALALLPGEDRDDPRLVEASTVAAAELAVLLGFFREGGRENLRALLRRLAGHAGRALDDAAPRAVPRFGGYWPGQGAVDLDKLAALLRPGRPVVPVVLYRALLLAADVAPIDALCDALAARGLAAAPLVVPSLKDKDAAAFMRDALARLSPAAIITTTAFAAGGNPGDPTPLDHTGVPVLQAVIANTRREAWRGGARGLNAADLAMHVVLPELDGRLLAGAIAFKDALAHHDGLAFTPFGNRPEPDRVAAVADRAAALVRLRRTPRAARRIAVLMPDYPGAPGRTGYAVGLDVPESVVALLSDLAGEGYTVERAPRSARALLDALGDDEQASFSLARYEGLLAGLPAEVSSRIRDAWGEPADDPDVRDGAFRFRTHICGNVVVALAPDRGRSTDRRADYHDPAQPPRHALLAFGLWLRHAYHADALVHMGAHGTLEWLPGKVVALTASCFPEAVVGPLPVIYPFIVSNPGEAAQAKRRLMAQTIGHLPPPLTDGELSGDARALEHLVDEYAQADGLDRRRRERLAKLIVGKAAASGLAREAGVAADDDPDTALKSIDAWLCDLKDLRIKDGLHVFGRGSSSPSPRLRGEGASSEEFCAQSERAAILAALDGRRVAPGPAGAPERGRRDVLPTGRNLYTADPRTLPTPTATEFGRLAADEAIRSYLQDHGDHPRALVIDLWGSATLRTGGEEIAQGLWLMGCRPAWDAATGRVTGIEVLPEAATGRPRVDVTFRISGLFRDLFGPQIALIDAAVRAIALRDERPAPARIFGSAPDTYGAGIEEKLGTEVKRDALGLAYLAAATHAYGGADGAGRALPGAFAEQVGRADLLLHTGDDPGRDLLEGSADAAFVGGFAAAARSLGATPDLVMLDTTDPRRPRARLLDQALARIVRARATSPRFIAGMMRHGPRGAAELAETVDRLIAFAETTDAVPDTLIDQLYGAYLGDPEVRAFLMRENPAAARAIADRLAFARRHDLWHPLRNDVDADLELLAEAAS